MTQPLPGPGPRPAPLASAELPGPDQMPPGVVQALARLEGLDATPVPEHVEVFDAVHRLLQDSLATLDEV